MAADPPWGTRLLGAEPRSGAGVARWPRGANDARGATQRAPLRVV